MNVLVLGGTGFLGPEVVEELIARKHKVTIFNRGRTNPGLFPDVEKLQGDRRDNLTALENRSWDVVIDVHASHAKWVKASCELLKKTCKVYVFVSTISVFNDYSKPGIAEDGPTFPMNPELDKEDRISNATYGPQKVRCEALVREHFPQTATIVRPGLIVGPSDPTDRFTYWPVRVDRGGEVLAPEPKDSTVQFVDARDLGAFIAQLVTDGHVGTYNATGPGSPLSMAEFLYGCRAATTSDVKFTWVDSQFLLDNKVGPFMEMPLWVPGDEMVGFMKIDCSKAMSVGLKFRPLAETARDTIAWAKTRPAEHKWGAGLNAEKEKTVLAAWHARKQ